MRFKQLDCKKGVNSKTKLLKASKFPISYYRCGMPHIGSRKVLMCVLFRFFPPKMHWTSPPIHTSQEHKKDIEFYYTPI